MDGNWKREAEKLLFAYGKAVLGKSAGGLITQLKNARGVDGAYAAIKACEGRQDSREYLTALMKGNGSHKALPGEIIDGWQWDGGKWKQLEG